NSGSPGKKVEYDGSEETEEDRRSLEITKQAVKILSEIYNIINPENNRESNSDVRVIHTSSKRKNSIYNHSLYQGDILLESNDALELIAEAKTIAEEKHVNINHINTEIEIDGKRVEFSTKDTSNNNGE
uniref:DUF2188 domain-containing protein n=1 Tax=Strongyloides papillosus TaxID=174720 RepID=A0A0N5C6S4_STREA